MATLAELLARLSSTPEPDEADDETPEPGTTPRGSRFADAVASPGVAPFGWQTEAPEDMFSKGDPVGNSTDLERVLALPRRPRLDLDSPTAEAIIELEMDKHGRDNPNCDCKKLDPRRSCIKRLLPVQAWMLREISMCQGLIASVTVGAGKCVVGSTEIMDYSQARRRRVDEPGELSVATFDRALRVGAATAFPSGSKPCIRVTTKSGTSIELSTDHPVLTARGWVEASDLTTTDFAAVAVEMPEPPKPTQATDAEVKFVAYMLADGGCSQSWMYFTNMTPSIIEDWSRSAEDLGYQVVERASRSKAREFSLKTNLGRWTKTPNTTRDRWGLHGLARDKRLHQDLWGLPRRQVALFLNRFLACDGHVSSRGIEVTLASEKMIDDLRFMLLRIGVRSPKHYKTASYVKNGVRHEFDAWRIGIFGANAQRLLEEIGPVLGKEEACSKLAVNLGATRRNTNFDVVPVGTKEILEIGDELDLRSVPIGERTVRGITALHKTLPSGKDQFVSRSAFIRFCDTWKYTGKFSYLATTDVAWDPIVSIEDIGVLPVFDLSVPGTHNFVANGVVIHNTLVDILGAMALDNVKQVLLLIPAPLRNQLQLDYQLISQHFKVPNLIMHIGTERPAYAPVVIPGRPTLHVMPYSRLSLPGASDFINALSPDAIICDEVDAVKSMASSRGIRLAKWFAGGETPEDKRKRMATKFMGWTGSLTDHSITEFNWLALFALKEQSPLPHDPMTVEEWGRCLDATTSPSPPGELMRFCSPGEEVRSAFGRHMAETPGFIIADISTVQITGGEGDVQLNIEEKEAPELPQIIQTALASVREGIRPDYLIHEVRPDLAIPGLLVNEELPDALAIAQAAQQVSCGVLYFWKFPRGEPVPLIKEYLLKRGAFNTEIREQAMRGETFLDSAMLCEEAAMRYWGDIPKVGNRPEWRCESWPDWRDIRDKVEPHADSCVLHDFIAQDAVDWGKEQPGIIWYNMKALATRMRELSGLPIHDGGTKGPARLRQEKGDRSIICSIKSNGRGYDGLQHIFHRQLLVNPPASATNWEQLLGRSHRRGQKSEVVHTEVYLHTPELRKAVDQAMRRSVYVQQLMKTNPKLLSGWKGILNPDADK